MPRTKAIERPPGLLLPILVGLVLAAGGLGGAGYWAATAEIASAAVAPGVVTVASKRRAIQHYEGGIVADIMVRENDTVAAGEPLIRVANAQESARTEQMRARESALIAEAARLRAELGGADRFAIPATIAGRDEADTALALQNELFEVRRERRAQAEDIAQRELSQVHDEIGGLDAQLDAKRIEAGYFGEREASVSQLVERGISSPAELARIRTEAAAVDADIAQLAAAREGAGERLEQRRAELASIATTFEAQAAERLQEVERELAEIAEGLIGASDVMARTAIVAPIDGRVVGLSVPTAGMVVPAGETLMEIVPLDDTLVVEALIDPQDIDVVHVGQPVDVRLTAFSFRNTLPVAGTLDQISADRIIDGRTNSAVYKAVVRLDDAATGAVELYPGMGAEVAIVTGEKTFLDYLLDPVFLSFSRAFREA